MFQKNLNYSIIDAIAILTHLCGSLLAAIVLGILLIGISECSAESKSKLVGKYRYNSDPKDPKMDKVFTAMGISKEQRSMIRMFLPNATMKISQSGDYFTIKSGVPLIYVTNKFKSGKEFDEEVHIGPKIKTTATVKGDKITFKKKLANGKKLKDVLECSEEGCVRKVSIGDDKAETKWKRIKEK